MTYTQEEIRNYVDIITKIALSGGNNKLVLSLLKGGKLPTGEPMSKNRLINLYKDLSANGHISLSPDQENTFYKAIKKKFIRSLSGVTTVTVLTMPYPCPGKCIFCPNDVRMPKSYISSEPGAQRALANKFDPYFQTYNRLVALNKNGHPTDKVELIILGGTWTFYPTDYRKWFIYRCFKALNKFDPVTSPQYLDTDQLALPLETVQEDLTEGKRYNEVIAKAKRNSMDYFVSDEEFDTTLRLNENSKSRCVGLSLETRPDELTQQTVKELRRLGATKIQVGVQVLDDDILEKNKRGHGVKEIYEAFYLLRQAGFKIQTHWMPNMYGSNPQKDLEMYLKLFSSDGLKPDEVKIYPCTLVPHTELEDFYKSGVWTPYTEDVLTKLLADCIINTPRYCRITRVIRDIPSNELLAGSQRTNMRQDAESLIKLGNTQVVEIRSREVKNDTILLDNLYLKVTDFKTTNSDEFFMEFVDANDKIAGFLRLSLPKKESFIPEISNNALIREIHVYGQTTDIGKSELGAAQHKGLGTKLITAAENIAKSKGYSKLSVISAIGTKNYYRKKGFHDGVLYQHKYLL